jgi:hypothetical protein
MEIRGLSLKAASVLLSGRAATARASTRLLQRRFYQEGYCHMSLNRNSKPENKAAIPARTDRSDRRAQPPDRRAQPFRDAQVAQPQRLRPSGGYRRLLSFQTATLVYDATVSFCGRFVDKRSRTVDQMVQAARSGRQNIAEGSRFASWGF